MEASDDHLTVDAVTCSHCHGTGKTRELFIFHNTCSHCGGAGYLEQSVGKQDAGCCGCFVLLIIGLWVIGAINS